MTKDQPSVHELLVAGRNIVAKGWTQGTLYDPHTGAHCARGGLLRADGGFHAEGWIVANLGKHPKVHIEALLELSAHLPHSASSGPDAIIWFNNADWRTQAEVLAVFDAAIAATAPPPDPRIVVDAREAVAA